MIERSNKCPKCGGTLLARYGHIIYCLRGSCDWATQSKRKTDEQIETINEQKDKWY